MRRPRANPTRDMIIFTVDSGLVGKETTKLCKNIIIMRLYISGYIQTADKVKEKDE